MPTPVVRLALSLCLGLALAAAARAQQFTWTVFAGSPPQRGSVDGPAAEARYYNPNSVAADAAGNLYVSDTFNHTIRRIAPNGTTATIAGLAGSSGTADGPAATARFSSPNGLAFDAAGNLYVADRSNHAIRRITPAGIVTTFAGLAGTSGAVDGPAASARFNTPSRLVFDREGHLLVADSANHAIRRIAPDGTVATVAGALGTAGAADGPAAAARFNSPAGIAINSIGDIFIADSGNYTVRRLDRAGNVSTLAGTAGQRGTTNGTGAAARFGFPSSLAVDPTDTLYLADSSNDCIRRISSDGIVTTFAGGADVRGSANGTGTAARFYSPFGIIWSPDGNLYVADTLNHTIRKLTVAGVVTNHSGPGGGFGYTEGAGTAARFNYPHHASVDPDGNLYVADNRNNAVRKITPAGVVSTYQTMPSPYGVAYGGGAVSVSNSASHFIRIFPLTSSAFFNAGTVGTSGAVDGPVTGALLNAPQGIAVDLVGRLVIADSGSHVIRFLGTINTQLSLITVAGQAGTSGSTNSVGTAARFSSPRGVAVDRAGNIYVADAGSHLIRRINGVTGAVTTLAGTAFTSGAANGLGAAARFSSPEGLAVDAAGNVYVADRFNHAIRLITPEGLVTTIGGLPTFSGHAEGTGVSALFSEPAGIAVDPEGTVYVVSTGNNIVMRGVLDRTPVITTQPQGIVAALGTSVTLSVSASGGGLAYQWKRDGTAIDGATAATYAIPGATAAANGSYTVDVRNSAGTVTSAPAQVTLRANVEVSRIVNLAIRSQAGTGAQTLIVGVGVGGAGTAGDKPILIRAIGPTLGAFGVAGVLPDPKLEVYSGATKINENDNWGGTAAITGVAGQVGAFALPLATSLDAALHLPALAAGSYSVQVTGTGALATGVALAEIYDASPAATRTAATPRLTNVSARTQVGTGGDILIAGFVIAGETSKTVLLRAIGPTLGSFGVGGALADPKLELFGAAGKITENDNWGGRGDLSATFFSVGAFPLTAASLDAVLLVTLAPGSYTAQISGANNGTGVALVEVYEVP